jgi:hypothetical protein
LTTKALTPILKQFLNEWFPGMDDQDHFTQFFEAYEKRNVDKVVVNLGDVAFMKVFCDTYYHKKVMPLVLKSKRSAEKEQTTGTVQTTGAEQK